MIDDAELTRRSMMGFGEMCAVTGLWGVGPEVVIRWPNALGAKIDSAGNPWISAAVVPLGASPPEDDPRLPMAVWTLGESIPGRAEAHGIATPCLGLSLDAPAMEFDAGEAVVGVPSMTTVAEVNERAYNQIGAFAPLVIGIQDGRIRTHGILVGGEFACVAITLRLHDDVGIFYVATEAEHRRQGLASRLIQAILAEARADGLRTSTLMASPDGLSVYEKLGFRQVARLRAFVRPPAGETS